MLLSLLRETNKIILTLIAEGESRDSTTYGVNRSSPLQELIEFDITKCLAFDVMHTLFERANHLNLLFHHLIDESHSLRLGELNHAISSHDYGYSEVDTKSAGNLQLLQTSILNNQVLNALHLYNILVCCHIHVFTCTCVYDLK